MRLTCSINEILFKEILKRPLLESTKDDVIYSDETMDIITSDNSNLSFKIIPSNRNEEEFTIKLDNDIPNLLKLMDGTYYFSQLLDKKTHRAIFNTDLNYEIIEGQIVNYLFPIIQKAYKEFNRVLKKG